MWKRAASVVLSLALAACLVPAPAFAEAGSGAAAAAEGLAAISGTQAPASLDPVDTDDLVQDDTLLRDFSEAECTASGWVFAGSDYLSMSDGTGNTIGVTFTATYDGGEVWCRPVRFERYDAASDAYVAVDDWRELEPGTGYAVLKPSSASYNIGGKLVTYIGEKRVAFELADPHDLSKATWSLPSDCAVELGQGGDIRPTMSVSIDGRPLEYGVDYVFDFADEGGTPVDEITSAGTYRCDLKPVDGTGYYNDSRNFNRTNAFKVVSEHSLETAYVTADASSWSSWDASSSRVWYVGAGETANPDFTIVLQDGTVLEKGEDFTVEYFSESTGTLSGNLEPGSYTATITAVPGGKCVGSCTRILVVNDARDLSHAYLTIDGDDGSDPYPYTGSPVVVNPALAMNGKQLGFGTDYVIEYSDDGWSTSTKNPPTAVGFYFVRAVPAEGSGFSGTSWECYFSIVDYSDIGNAVIEANESVVVYDSEIVAPVPIVKVRATESGKTAWRYLREGVDFKLAGYVGAEGSAEDAAPTPTAGRGHFVIEGMGAYHGKVVKGAFTLVARGDVAPGGLTVQCEPKQYLYTGSGVSPNLVVKYGDRALSSDQYEIKHLGYANPHSEETRYGIYSNGEVDQAVRLGWYSVWVEATIDGRTVGPMYDDPVRFSIVRPTSINVSSLDDSFVYSGAPIDLPTVTSAAGATLERGRDYRVWITAVDGTHVDQVVDPGEYLVEVEGAGEFSGQSTSASMRVYAQDHHLSNAEVRGVASTYTYQPKGTVISPEVVLAGNVLDKDCYSIRVTRKDPADGTVSDLYASDGRFVAVQPGDYSYQITGAGDYGGSVSGSFKVQSSAPVIELVNISRALMALSQASFTYDGRAKNPSVSLSYAGKSLAAGIDYQLSYLRGGAPTSDFKSVGTVTVVATGKSAYANTISKTFTIVPAGIGTAQITLAKTSYTYDGTAKRPAIASVVVGGRALKEGVDFTSAYSANVAAGTAKVTITGKGNYQGSKYATFQIKPASLSPFDLLLSSLSYTWNGKPKRPAVTVAMGGTLTQGLQPMASAKRKLVKDRDYTVSYKNNVEPGTARVTVKGKGNYAGSISTKFKIGKAANTLKVVGKTAKIKRSKLKRARGSLARKSVLSVSKPHGKVIYRKLSGSKKVSVSKTGVVSVAKGTAKGTYRAKVRISAAGDRHYKPVKRTVTFVVRVA